MAMEATIVAIMTHVKLLNLPSIKCTAFLKNWHTLWVMHASQKLIEREFSRHGRCGISVHYIRFN